MRAHDRTRIVVIIPTLLDFYRGVLRGVAAFCREQSMSLTYLSHEDVRLPDIKRTGADGVIAAVTTRSLLEMIRRGGLPTVNVSSRLAGVPFPSVLSDNVAIGRRAAEHLLSRGFRSFAFATPTGMWYGQVRRDEFARVVGEAGFSCAMLELGRDTDQEEGIRILRQQLPGFLRPLPRPVAMMACTDFWGWQVLEAARHARINVPAELAVVASDNDPTLCEISWPPLSSVDPRAKVVGYEAARLLAGLIRGGEAPEEMRVIPPGEVVVRASTDTVATEDADVADALRLLRSRSGNQLSVKELAVNLNMSRRTLERRFERALGRTPGEELRMLRLERAKQLLAETTLPMARIATMAGFSYASHFTQVFRRATGLTPSEWRTQYRQG